MVKELGRRPLVIGFAALLIGVTALSNLPNLLFLVPLAFTVRSMQGRLLAALFFVAGLLVAGPLPGPPAVPANGVLEGRVASRPRPLPSGRQWCLLQTAEGPAKVELDPDTLLIPGEKVRVKGRLLDMEALPLLDAYSVQQLAGPPPLERWANGIRDEFSAFTSAALAPREATLLNGIVFSSTTDLSQDSRTEFIDSNTVHLVTESGLHVLLIAMGIQALMGLLPIQRGFQVLLLVFVLFLFVAVSGFHASTIRASVVAIVVRSAYLFRREADLLSALSAAGIAILAFDPIQAQQLGFQLTMAATLAIALFGRLESGKSEGIRSRLSRTARTTLRIGAVATLATAPILAQTQHAVVGTSLVASLLASLVLPAVLVLSAGAFVLGSPLGAAVLRLAVAPLLGWMEWIVHFFAQSPVLRLEFPPFSGYWLALLYGIALWMWRPSVRRA